VLGTNEAFDSGVSDLPYEPGNFFEDDPREDI